MKRVLLLAALIAVNFIAIHYLLKGQPTIISVLVISAIAAIFGFIYSRSGEKPRGR